MSAGSRVEYEIVNVAQTAHLLAPLTGRDVLRASPTAFAQLLGELEERDELGRHEGCPGNLCPGIHSSFSCCGQLRGVALRSTKKPATAAITVGTRLVA